MKYSSHIATYLYLFQLIEKEELVKKLRDEIEDMSKRIQQLKEDMAERDGQLHVARMNLQSQQKQSVLHQQEVWLVVSTLQTVRNYWYHLSLHFIRIGRPSPFGSGFDILWNYLLR